MAFRGKRMRPGKHNGAPQVEELEPRLLFSADAVGLLAPDSLNPDQPATEILLDENLEPILPAPRPAETQDQRLELAFVDTRTPDYQQVVLDLLSQPGDDRRIEVVLLDDTLDGIDQVSEALQTHRGADAIHLISHGSDGALQLGTTLLTDDFLPVYEEELRGWGEYLDAEADILIYGCNLAASPSGQSLVDGMASLTGADVAASNDLTGHQSLGGDWNLEVQTGNIESQLAVSASLQQTWQGVLVSHYVVSTTADSGVGSLRQAIIDANASGNSGGPDVISFDIGADGSQQTINLLSALDPISEAVTIDGFSQYGALTPSIPLIEINGAGTSGANGFTFQSGSNGSTVQGVMITRFDGFGIQVDSGADGVIILGNWIGTTGTGTTGDGNGNNGINVQGVNTIIGGTGTNDGNVITNNGNEGINITGSGATGTIIQGNIIGLDPDGATGSGNTDVGIALLSGSDNTIIGGTSVAARNVISNNYEGIEVNSNNNTIQGNYIGTDSTGTLDRGNRSDDGIEIQNNATGNLIGGTEAGAGNLIAFNALDGVNLVNGSENTLLGNQIYSNGDQDIDLGAGANNAQTAPTISGAFTNGSQINILGSLNSTANSFFRIEFFGADQNYLGFTNVATDGSGNATFNVELNASVAAGDAISASATLSEVTYTSYTDTSELSAGLSASAVSLAVDATSSGTGTVGSFSISHTTTGVDRLMLVAVTLTQNMPTDVVSGVTYNGAGLSLVGTQTEGQARVEIWSLVNPDAGTFNVDITMAGTPLGVTAGVTTFTGVDQATPYGSFASDSGASNVGSLSYSSQSDEIGFSAIAINSATNLSISNHVSQTEIWEENSIQSNGAASTEPGSAPTGNSTWAWTGSLDWAAAGVSVKPVNNVPTITSDGGLATATINLAENETRVTTVIASDPDGDFPTYSISGGADQALFSILPFTGQLDFLTPPDFENPGDAGANNGYEVEITADDGDGGIDTQLITVNVSNEDPIANGAWFDESNGGGGYADFATLATAHATYMGATEQSIDLESLTSGDVLSNQFTVSHGVTFSNTGNPQSQVYSEGAAWIENVTGYDGSYAADGSNVYLRMFNDNANTPFTIDFATPVAKVGALLGMGKEGVVHDVVVSLYDSGGNLIDRNVLTAELWDATTTDNNYETFFGASYDSAIISKIEILNVSNTSYANALIFDQLTWSTTPDSADRFNAVTAVPLVTGNVLANDIDPAGGSLTVSTYSQPANGAVSYNNDGTFTYTSDPGFSGTDSFTYTIVDGSGGIDTAAVEIEVNSPPMAGDDPLHYADYLDSFNPVGYWRLGESSGGSASDETGLNSGSYNAVTLRQGGAIGADVDHAARFDGVGSHLEISHDPAYLVDEGTVQLWFKTPDVNRSGHLFSKDAIGFTSGGHLGVYLDGSGDVGVRLQSASADYFLTSATPLVDNQWHHVVLTFGSGGMALYLDGQLQDSDVYTGGLGTSSGGTGNDEPIAIGASTQLSGAGTTAPLEDFFHGFIDEVALLGSALTPTEVQQLYDFGVRDYSLAEGGTLVVNAADGVLANDTDAEGDSLNAVLVSGPASAASFNLNADGSFDYTPVAGFIGSDTFTYRANDGFSDSGLATVTIMVTNVSNTPALWMSTDANVSAPGADGLPAGWTESEVLEFSGPGLSHGDTTAGQLSSVLDFGDFTANAADTGALHYVNRDMTVGGGANTFDLQVGDVLVSFLQDETILAPYTVSGLDELVEDGDLLVFRPAVTGDFSDGSFHMLLDGVVADDLKGVTLVEQDTTVGGTLVEAGSFLVIAESSATTSVDLFVPTGVGAGNTTGSTTVFIDISNLGIDANRLRGIDLVETGFSLGGQTLPAGSLLATLNVDDDVSGVGSNNLLVQRNDVFLLELTATGPGTTAGTATLFFDGQDVGVDNNPSEENPYALTLFDTVARPSTAPIITSGSAFNVPEGTTTVTTVTATDSDGDGIDFSISGGADGGLFSIDPDSGDLSFNAAPDFGSPADSNGDNVYLVEVTADDGVGYIDTQVLSVTVTTVNVAPTDLYVAGTDTGSLGINEDGGNDAYLLADDGSALLGGLTELTVEFQFSVSTPAADNTTLLSYAQGSNDEELAVMIKPDGTIWFLAHTNASALQATSNQYPQLLDGNVHHLAVTWDSSTGAVDFYVDGLLAESFTGYQTGQAISAGGELVFGQDQDSVLGGFNPIDTFQGALHDIRIFNDVRTPAEIAASFSQQLPSSVPGLIANWQFDNLSGTGVVSETVAGNNLNLQHVGAGGGFTTSAPELSLLVNEDAADGTVIGTLAGADPNVGDTLTYTLLNDAGGRFDIASGTGVLTVENGALLDYDSNSSHTILVEVSDGSLTYSESFTVFLTPADEPPQNSVPGAQVVTEDALLTFNTANGNLLSISDESGETPTAILSVNNGVLWASGAGSASVSGDGTSTLTLTGSVAEINLALDGLQYDSADDYVGSDTLSITTTDGEIHTFNIDPDLAARYEFASADAAADSSPGAANSGVLAGDASVIVDAGRGDVLALDGSGDYLDVPAMATTSQNITLSSWVNLAAGATTAEIIDVSFNLSLRLDATDGVQGAFWDGTSVRETNSGVMLDGSGWHHVAYTVDTLNNEQILYVDGEIVAASYFFGSIVYAGGDSHTYLGATQGSSNFFEGELDQTRIYDRVLTPVEIDQLASAPAIPVDSDTVAITVNPDNDAPVLTNGSAGTYGEGNGVAPFVSSTVVDIDSTDLAGGTLSFSIASGGDGTDTLRLGGFGGVSESGSDVYVGGVLVGTQSGGTGGSTFTVNFNNDATVARVQSVFQALIILNQSDNPATGVRNLEVTLTDGDGGTSNTATATANLTALENDDPGNAGTLPTDISVTEDLSSNLDLSAIDLTDPDANSAELTVTLTTSTGGALSFSAGAGITLGGTPGAATLTGTLANLNTYFNNAANISYLHGTAHFNGDDADTLSISVVDNGNTGSGGGAPIDLGTINIDISPVNDIPTGAVTIDNTSPAEGDTLTASNTLVDADGLGAITYTWRADGSAVGTGSTYTLTQSEVGAVITVEASYTDGGGQNELLASSATAAVLNVNNAPIGAVTIDNTTPSEGDTLTASNTLADVDGLGVIAYTWKADGVTVGTGATYTLTPAEVGTVITAEASYTDAYGASELVASAPTSAVANVNNAPTGSVTIDNTTPAQGDTLTASNTLADLDGLGAITYTWMADGTTVGTGATYTLSQAEVGTVITVEASYTDGYGRNEVVASAGTAAVANVNDAPTGGVTIDNTTPAQGDTLTASNTLADADGLGAITYTWKADGITVGTGGTYTLTQSEVGTVITVEASYTDAYGASELVASAPTSAVANLNSAPTGSVTIDNTTPAQGDTLTASNTLADLDGLGAITYTWMADGTTVGTGATYTLSQAEVGTVITVEASYIDGYGTNEVVASPATAAVGNVDDPAMISGDTSYSGNEGDIPSGVLTATDADGLADSSYFSIGIQGVYGTATIDAETGAWTYTPDAADWFGSDTFDVIVTDDLGGITIQPVSVSLAAVNDRPAGAVIIDNTSPAEGDTLSASNNLSDADGLSGPISYQWYRNGVAIAGETTSTYTTVQADVGMQLSVVASYSDDQGTPESVSSSQTAAVSNVNDAPTGTVTISGSATEDQTLTASNTLADEDGMGAVTYQWQRDGSDIAGATADTYSLDDADVGASISVLARYVDAHGTSEGPLPSAQTAAVANVNDAPVGRPGIAGIVQEGRTLSADTSAISDADGLGVISLQWQRSADGGQTWVVAGSGSQFLLTAADAGVEIRVEAVYTDAQGTLETLSSDPVLFIPREVIDSANEPDDEPQENPEPDSVEEDELLQSLVTQAAGNASEDSTPTAAEQPSETQQISEEQLPAGARPDPKPPAVADEPVEEPVGELVAGESVAESAPEIEALPQEIVELIEGAAEGRMEPAQTPELARFVGSATAAELQMQHMDEVLNSHAMWREIDTMKRQIGGEELTDEQLVVQYVSTGSAGLVAGMVAYALRGGALVASLLGTMPAWRAFDPLPVLASGKKDTKKDEDDLSESESRENVEVIFD